MKYYLENISYVEFINRLNKFIDLISKEKTDLENPKNEILEFLNKSIKPNIEIFEPFLNYFEYSIYNDIKSNSKPEFCEYEKEDYIIKFKKLIDYFSIIDYFDKPEEFVLLDSISEKSDFLLEKLNYLFNDNFYSPSLIFKLNNIEYRNKEPREIAENLSKRGYLILEQNYGDLDYSKLSIKGANYIERKLKSKSKEKQNYKKNTRIDKKLNQIIEHLTKLGFGQEIIFEEIEEMRELQTKLNKKSWKQLIKMKLYDLAIDEILSQETANQIFEFLSNTTKKLIE